MTINTSQTSLVATDPAAPTTVSRRAFVEAATIAGAGLATISMPVSAWAVARNRSVEGVSGDELTEALQHSYTDPFDRTSPAIPIGPHWMIIWPFDATAAGLPTVMRDAGTLVMFAGTPYAHLHVCGSPWDGNELRAATLTPRWLVDREVLGVMAQPGWWICQAIGFIDIYLRQTILRHRAATSLLVSYGGVFLPSAETRLLFFWSIKIPI
jgi:hypothetical protein